MRNRIVLSSLLLLAGCGRGHQNLYPLKEGLTWEYQVSFRSVMGMPEGQRATLTNQPQGELWGRKVTPQRLDIGQESHFMFVASDETGIYEYARQDAAAVEPEIRSTPEYFLKYPLEAGATWDGTTETNWLARKVRVSTRTTVETLDETVTVSAGSFRNCVKTKTFGDSSFNLGVLGRAKVTVEEHSWFCPGVGLVKAVLKEGSDHFMMG